MPISPARIAAFEILLRVEQTASYASDLLNSAEYGKLSSQDHALATELAMGVLRWRSALDTGIARCSSQKLRKLDVEVLTSLRLAAYQLLRLQRIPPRAAVHESVELVRKAGKSSAAPFVNAVLRRLAGGVGNSGAGPEAPAAKLAEEFAHPHWLVERWIQMFGATRAEQICAYDQVPPQAAIRGAGPEIEEELQREGIRLRPGRILAAARRLEKGNIAATRACREAQVSIQDEGSQLVAMLAGNGARILDCCAAPGGKTRVLAERNPQAEITAVELHAHRARLLRKLVPAQNVHVITADILQLPVEKQFDLVLADVPCSGTGTVARNPEIKWRLAVDDLAELAARQLAILKAAMGHVARGGRLVYSTCSLEPEENSDVVERALAVQQGFRSLDLGHDLRKLKEHGELNWEECTSLLSGPYLQTIPGAHPCDGFFAAAMQRVE